MIIHIGEKPNSQINNADTTGIHKLYRLILADRPMVKVGAAINATTAGRIPLNMRSTIGLSLKEWKKSAMARMMINEVISMGLRGIGFGAFSSVIYGMLADTVEYGEWKTGVRTQAINVTANGVGQKIGSGLGTAAFGSLLTMCGYNGMAEVQTASAVSCIRIIFIVAPIAIYLILIVLAWLFKLDKQFPQIQKELEERKRSKAAVN